MTLALTFILLFAPQTQDPTTVPVVLNQGAVIVIVDESFAREEFERLRAKKTLTQRERARFAALAIALGTIPRPQMLPRANTRAWLDNEIRRGRRAALQQQ